MARRLRALRGLHYPADAKSLAIVKKAGGLSKLSPDERMSVRMKKVAAGGFCDDVPTISRPGLLEGGRVEWVDVGDAAEAGSGAQSEAAPPTPSDEVNDGG